MSPPASPVALEIRTARLRLGYADYPRPCIVTHVPAQGLISVLPLSTKHYGPPGESFRVDATHPDFPATGLSATSFTAGPIRYLPLGDIGPRKGRLQGDLARAFLEWLG